jgi:hypothetical protein
MRFIQSFHYSNINILKITSSCSEETLAEKADNS